MAAVFVPQQNGCYDLQVDGRTREYDVEPWDLEGAARRARITYTTCFIEDDTGHRTRCSR